MTNKRLDAIRQRLGKATAGEWSHQTYTTGADEHLESEIFAFENPATKRLIAKISPDFLCAEDLDDEDINNVYFIAHSKQDITYLLKVVEKQAKALHEIIDKDPLEINGHWWEDGSSDEIAQGVHEYFYEIAQQALKCDEGGEEK